MLKPQTNFSHFYNTDINLTKAFMEGNDINIDFL